MTTQSSKRDPQQQTAAIHVKPSTRTFRLPLDAVGNYIFVGPAEYDESQSRPSHGVAWWTITDGPDPRSYYSVIARNKPDCLDIEVLLMDNVDLSYVKGDGGKYEITVERGQSS